MLQKLFKINAVFKLAIHQRSLKNILWFSQTTGQSTELWTIRIVTKVYPFLMFLNLANLNIQAQEHTIDNSILR